MRMIIVGCGRTGADLVGLLTLRGHAVTVVDHDPAAFQRLGPMFKGQTVTGVGFDRGVLLRAGIERADGVAVVTGSDEANAVIGRMARLVFQVPRVVARLYDPRKADVYGRLGLQTIAPVAWGINRIAEILCHSWLEPLVSLGSGGVDLVETEVPVLLAGKTVAELTVAGEIHVAAISRGGRTFLPTAGAVFREGDLVHLVVVSASMDRLKTLLGHP